VSPYSVSQVSRVPQTVIQARGQVSRFVGAKQNFLDTKEFGGNKKFGEAVPPNGTP